MNVAIVSVIGVLLGLAAHDLAIQGLTGDRSLRPLVGVCPQCASNRGWHRLRCPQCSRRIQREPVVAVVAALVAVGIFNMFGWSWLLVPYLGFLLLSMALLITDLEDFRIVDRLNLRGTLILAVTLAAIVLPLGEGSALVRSLLGAAAYFGGAFLMWILVRGRGFGAGDVKLAPLLGLFTAFISWGALGWAVFAMAIIGGVVAVFMIVTKAAKRDTEIPYGPPMVLGAWLAISLAGLGAFPLPS